MAVSISSLDRFKVETEFGEGYVVQTTYDWEFSERRLKEISTWTEVRLLGTGAFGSVWLEQKKEGGQLRAVKKLRREFVKQTGFSQELVALVTLADVRTRAPIESCFYLAETKYLVQSPVCRVLWLVRKQSRNIFGHGVRPVRRPKRIYERPRNGQSRSEGSYATDLGRSENSPWRRNLPPRPETTGPTPMLLRGKALLTLIYMAAEYPRCLPRPNLGETRRFWCFETHK